MKLMKYSVLLMVLAVCGCEAAKPPEPQGAVVKKSTKANRDGMSAVNTEPP